MVGMPGSGKSTVGETLAGRLAWLFVDIDELFERSAGSQISNYVSEHGWAKFRQRELLLLEKQLKESKRVVATGGGVVDSKTNCGLLKKATRVVWLRASLETLSARLTSEEREKRPLLEGNPDILEQLLRRRNPLFASVADYTLDVNDHPVDKLAERVISYFRLDRK